MDPYDKVYEVPCGSCAFSAIGGLTSQAVKLSDADMVEEMPQYLVTPMAKWCQLTSWSWGGGDEKLCANLPYLSGEDARWCTHSQTLMDDSTLLRKS